MRLFLVETILMNWRLCMKTKLPLLIIIGLLVTVAFFIPGAGAYDVFSDDENAVHEYIAEQARDLYNQSHPDSEITSSLFCRLLIFIGAGHEDNKDHVYDREGDFGWTTLSHFWDADLGPDDMVECAGTYDTGNSWMKAQSLWAMAVGEYRNGNKVLAYEYLGHVVHLLGDMSVPAHVHEDMHPTLDSFEKWMSVKPVENAQLSAAEKADLLEKGPVVIPEGSAESSLYYLLYTQNQIADFFPSDDSGHEGDTIDNYGGWMDGIYTELGMDSIDSPRTSGDLLNNWCPDPPLINVNDDDGDLGTIRQYSYLYSIRSVAALYQLFDETVSSRSSLTVVVDEVIALDTHDPATAYPSADYFVEITINDALYRNEGNLIDDNNHIYPHWAFGRDVGVTGSIPIVIALWDDDFPLVDDLSDIKPAEGRNLHFSVNLTTGAISGDITGTCGTPLDSWGYESDKSHIKFRVLLPNIPPTADAGPDQTVDEGDLVTLNGSFTDPNTEDTHTILWHMESSTNGQVVPDSAGDPMNFTPDDNGVYTFRYTVTDNYGASGSDDVIITVNNVAPVVSAPYILAQPNSEFILPVVHAVDFKGGFSDPGTADTHTAFWDWGDTTTSPGTVDESEGSGNVTGSHTYALPGDYTITLNVTDDDGGTGDNTMTIHVADTEEALDIFNEYIQGLDNSKFKEKASQRKNALDNMFRALDKKLKNQAYRGFIQDLRNNIRPKADGQVDGKAADDWITDAEAQQHICMKVDDITAYVETFLVKQKSVITVFKKSYIRLE